MSRSMRSPAIEGFDEELAAELQNRAAEALERREAAAREERRGLGVEDALAEMPYLTEAMLVTFGKAGIKTLDDLADLATDELVQKKRPEQRRQREPNNRPEDKGGVLAEYGLSDEQGNEIIMAARAHWFEDEDAESGRTRMRPQGRTRMRKPPNEAAEASASELLRAFAGGRIAYCPNAPASSRGAPARAPISSASRSARTARSLRTCGRGRRGVGHGSASIAPRSMRPTPRASSRARSPGRSRRASSPFPADLGERIETALRQDALNRLGLEARAGNLATGSERIEDAARDGQVHALLPRRRRRRGRQSQARSGLAGRRRRGGNASLRGLVLPVDRPILSMALGRENVVHVAITDRAAAARVNHALARWRAFIGADVQLSAATAGTPDAAAMSD